MNRVLICRGRRAVLAWWTGTTGKSDDRTGHYLVLWPGEGGHWTAARLVMGNANDSESRPMDVIIRARLCRHGHKTLMVADGSRPVGSII